MRSVHFAAPGVIAAALLAGATPAQRQEKSQEELTQLREEKLSKPVFEGWVSDYAEAKSQAKETGKPIFAYFTRSYAT